MIQETENTIVVVGLPGSGKSHLTEKLKSEFPEYSVYSTDDYMQHGYEQSLYKLIDDIQANPNPKKIVEGVQAYRLLRKGLQLNSFHADLVITVEADFNDRIDRLSMREKSVNADRIKTFDKNLTAIWEDYTSTVQRAPRFLTVNT